MRGLLTGLAHPGAVQRRVEAVPGAGVAVELVAQDDDQVADRGHGEAFAAGAPPLLRRLRQASEQWRTCSQFFAQALRQLMGRPQVTQGLLGRWALWPRRGVDMD